MRMNFIDSFFLLALGLLLVARPQLFFKGGGSAQEVAKRVEYLRTRRSYLRKVGYVMIAAAVLLAVSHLPHPR